MYSFLRRGSCLADNRYELGIQTEDAYSLPEYTLEVSEPTDKTKWVQVGGSR